MMQAPPCSSQMPLFQEGTMKSSLVPSAMSINWDGSRSLSTYESRHCAKHCPALKQVFLPLLTEVICQGLTGSGI